MEPGLINVDNSKQVAVCARNTRKDAKSGGIDTNRTNFHHGFIRFVRIRVIRVSNSLAPGGLPAFAKGFPLRARLRRDETARQARNDTKTCAMDSDEPGLAPNKKPPRAEAWRPIVKYWLCLPELKGSAAHDLTVDYDVNAIGANTERTRTQIVNVLATVDSEV